MQLRHADKILRLSKATGSILAIICSLSLSRVWTSESKCWFFLTNTYILTRLPLHAHVLSARLLICANQSNTTEEAYLWLTENQRYDKWRIRWNGLPFMRHYHVSWQTFAVAVRACKSSKPSTAKEKEKAKESEWEVLQFLREIRSFKAGCDKLNCSLCGLNMWESNTGLYAS